MQKLTCLLIITLTVMLPACGTAELSEESVLFYQARTEEWEAAFGPYHLWNYCQRAMFCSIYHRLPGDYFNPEETVRSSLPTIPPEEALSYEEALHVAVDFLCSYDVCITEDDLYRLHIASAYVMEFLQIKPDTHVYEGDLEQALIDHLQQFLLELGRGFSFVARQKRFTLDGQNFFIDLVFYNYILKCFVLIDLKMGQLTHQDIGQMQMYVNYYTRELMNEGDTPPIGIVMCADKSDAVIKYTLPENNN